MPPSTQTTQVKHTHTGMLYPSRPELADNDGAFACAVPLYTHPNFTTLQEHDEDKRRGWYLVKHLQNAAVCSDASSLHSYLNALGDLNFRWEHRTDEHKIKHYVTALEVAHNWYKFCTILHRHPTSHMQREDAKITVPAVALNELVFHDPTLLDKRLALSRTDPRTSTLFPRRRFIGDVVSQPRGARLKPFVQQAAAPQAVVQPAAAPQPHAQKRRREDSAASQEKRQRQEDGLDPVRSTMQISKRPPSRSSSSSSSTSNLSSSSTSTAYADTKSTFSDVKRKGSTSTASVSARSKLTAVADVEPVGVWYCFADGRIFGTQAQVNRAMRDKPAEMTLLYSLEQVVEWDKNRCAAEAEAQAEEEEEEEGEEEAVEAKANQ
ncbi:hypothetical protein B0H16DRAFT_1745822 [Mycena metata]|uniref:Uncharacterized protein n=1 Tax=Mycena metata TaxID=1033252 RepID=A0AAD7H0W8_9AGAR|nr:hypothetical protein B0H16DRAFT_1745822 [Mycena metata]